MAPGWGAMNEVAALSTLRPTHTTYLNVVENTGVPSVIANILDSPAQYSIVLLVEEWVIFPDDSLE